MTPQEWLIIFLVFTMLLGLVLGHERNPLFLFLSALAGVFLALNAFILTGDYAVPILIAAVAIFILLDAIQELLGKGKVDTL